MHRLLKSEKRAASARRAPNKGQGVQKKKEKIKIKAVYATTSQVALGGTGITAACVDTTRP
jgi:hypothetical protein